MVRSGTGIHLDTGPGDQALTGMRRSHETSSVIGMLMPN
jgi:hypothetical protein